MKLNRIFALILTLCMLFSLAQFPVSAQNVVFEASGEIFTYANAVYSDASASGVDDEGYTVYAVSLPTNPVFSQSEYYAKSLTSYQKPIYRAVMDAFCVISANSLKLKQKVEVSYTTEYTTSITTQAQFNTFVNNKLNEEAQKLDLQTLYNAIQYDHTELFWMQGVFGSTAVGASYDGSVATLYWTVSMAADASDLFASDAALRTAATSMNTVVNSILTSTPTTSEYDALVYFNKWLKDNNTYNNTHLQNNNYPLAHGAYSAFTSNNNEPTGPVCQGYAYALKYLCDRIGIRSVIVTGMLYQSYSSPGPHAWNAVEIDGNWYAIDTTANDGLGTDEYNFLVGSNTPSHDSGYPTFASSHVTDNTHTYPTLSTTKYKHHVDCTHSYSNDCDTTCNNCGEVREASAHIYDDDCDTTCNECGAKRTVQHVYDNTCDKNCNRCGEIRVIVHTYDDDTDTVCNVCGEERELTTPVSSFEYEIKNNKVTIKQYIGTETDVIIPKTIEGYPVTELGSSAFYQNSSVKSVILPDGLELIGSFAFFRCYGITEMKIPDSVKTINAQAFNDCKSLKTIDLGEGIQVIKDRAFYGCEALESITFPSSLTTLAYNVFSGCKALTEITIPATITSLDTDMFTHCTGLKSVVIEEGVTTIPEYTFYNCNQLTTVTLPASVATVERAAFHSCTSITTVHFAGSKADRDSMSIGQWNDAFINATWCYDGAGNDDDDVVEGCSHTYDNGCDIICNECGETRTKLVGTKVTGLKASNVSLSYPYQRYGNDLSTMFDGDTTAVDGNGMQLNWSASTDAKTIQITLNDVTDLSGMNIYWGNNDWNAVPAQTYYIFLAGEDGVMGSSAVYEYHNSLTNQDGVLRDDFITFSEVQKDVKQITIMVVAHYKKGDLAIRELEILEATYVPVEVPEHQYDNNCDADCNECGTTRTVPDHIYDTNCDADCNECGATRTVPDHIYDNAYDPDCNECGEVREVPDKNPPKLVVENKTVRVGDTFTVTVSINDNSGIIGLRAYLGYDSNLLELVSIEKGEAFADTSFGPLTQNPMSILWDGSLEENNTENGILATLTFKVKETAEAGTTALAISYEPQDIYDSNWDNVHFETEDGTVTIIDYISGDVNGDGFVNNKDFGILRQYLNGWSVTVDTLAADVNRDGSVNNKDMGILRQYLNGWDVTLK